MDHLDELFNNIEFSSYITVDKSLKTDTYNGISFQDIHDNNILGLDYKKIMYSSVIKEISIGLEKYILDDLSKSKRSYIDLTDLDPNTPRSFREYQESDNIIRNIISYGKKNCIVSSKIATMFMDSKFYTRDGNNSKLGGINLYVNTNYSLKKNELEIFLFDDVRANIDFVSIGENYNHNSNNTNISYKQSHSIGESNCIVILLDKEEPAYIEYKSILREKKLNSILDD
jgi:hypothetical protein